MWQRGQDLSGRICRINQISKTGIRVIAAENSGWDRIRILNSPVTSAVERHISRGAEQRPGYAAGTAAWKCLFPFIARNLKSARKRCSWKSWTPAAWRQGMKIPGKSDLSSSLFYPQQSGQDGLIPLFIHPDKGYRCGKHPFFPGLTGLVRIDIHLVSN